MRPLTVSPLPTIPQRRAALEARHPQWSPVPLDGLLARAAAEFPERPLVLTDARTLSYAEADAWATRLADGLTALGVRPGDRVGVLMANHLEFVPIKFAIARAGAVAIPFNFLYKADELLYVLRQSRCHALVTMTGFQTQDYLGMLDAIAPGWEAGTSTALPELAHVVQLSTDGRTRDGVPTLADLERLGEQHAAPQREAGDPQGLGDILYTSGTTGAPKGVMVTHDGVLRTAYASAHHRAFEDGRRILFSLPCYHMFGYVEGLLAAMFVGGAIVPRTAFDPADQLAAVERHRASEVLCVPTMTIAIVEHPDRHARDLSSVFALLSGAAPGPVWLWERVRDDLGITEITTGYGMTETGGAMTMTLPEDGFARHAQTVGRPKLAGVAGLPADPSHPICTYATADALSGERLPPGTEGELVSSGPTHMLGFWDKPEETARALRDGWVHSGDLGLVDADGYLRLTGRSKELYKSGGELVMPKEIEELLCTHPGVSQAYAVGVPDERWGEVGCAWVVAEPGASLDPDVLIALCKERLARFKVPKHVLLTSAEALPTTPTGKVQKFRLVQQAAERLAASAEPAR
ncbi:MAG: acyl--CoA ligase [Solirubrobacterales bacterium]|nr:acyl--CoA ligase [Solirubrobacterales bacterium]